MNDAAALARPQSKRSNLPGLQYIRGVAAMLVVAFHAQAQLGANPALPQAANQLLLHAFIGVDVFFCLSGFIIVYVSLKPTLAPAVGPWEFYKRRAARILPFLWFAVLAHETVRFFGLHMFDGMRVLRTLVLWPGVVSPSVVWTLRFEALFYIIFGATVLVNRRLVWLVVAWVAASILWPASSAWADILFNRLNLLFGIGMLIGVAALRAPASWTLPPAAGLILPVLMAGILALATVLNYDRNDLAVFLVIALACGVIVAFGALMRGAADPLSRLAAFLGDASYAIYLTHLTAIYGLASVLPKLGARLGDPALLAIYTLAATAFGCVLHVAVERPLVAGAQRLLRGRKAKPANPRIIPAVDRT